MFNNLKIKRMKKRILKVVSLWAITPFVVAIYVLYSVGCMLKTVCYLTLCNVKGAETEVLKPFDLC